MATFDSGRQRYSMNFYASHQRPLQRRSYTGRPSRPAEGQLRVIRVDFAISATGPLTLGKRPPEPRVTVWFDLCEATDIQPIRLDLKGCAAAV